MIAALDKSENGWGLCSVLGIGNGNTNANAKKLLKNHIGPVELTVVLRLRLLLLPAEVEVVVSSCQPTDVKKTYK